MPATHFDWWEEVPDVKLKQDLQFLASLTEEGALELTPEKRNDYAALAIHAAKTSALELLLSIQADPLASKQMDLRQFSESLETVDTLVDHYPHGKEKLAWFFVQALITRIQTFSRTHHDRSNPRPVAVHITPIILTAITTLAPTPKPLIFQVMYNLIRTLAMERTQYPEHSPTSTDPLPSDDLLTAIFTHPSQTWLHAH
ncbi:hypothetical protein HK097_001388, partial [Rhizophlyctis rosea]